MQLYEFLYIYTWTKILKFPSFRRSLQLAQSQTTLPKRTIIPTSTLIVQFCLFELYINGTIWHVFYGANFPFPSFLISCFISPPSFLPSLPCLPVCLLACLPAFLCTLTLPPFFFFLFYINLCKEVDITFYISPSCFVGSLTYNSFLSLSLSEVFSF